MSESTFNAPTGTKDVIGDESAAFAWLVGTFSRMAHLYGFGLIVSPMFEDVGVFNRGIGEGSDVAKKEMYVFEDRGGRTLALRPEGTASVVRAFVQHHPTPPWKVYYVTPAFRYERPQAGRYRQHHQVGVEALGTDDPGLDVEVIALAWNFYRALGLTRVSLLINSMGHPGCRAPYLALLRSHLEANEASLCDEHREVYRNNPLRTLDCKKEPCVEVTSRGPMLIDHLCEACRAHHESVLDGLRALQIPFSSTPRLVRGFDYYTRTTFEFAGDALDSAQNAIGGGGRYDQLARELGGDETSGIGFGSGIERLLMALAAESVEVPTSGVEVFVVDTSDGAHSLRLVEELRAVGISADRAYDQRSMKAQMKAADRSGATLALLIGPKEIDAASVTMRDLRGESDGDRQRSVPRDNVVAAVRTALGKEPS